MSSVTRGRLLVFEGGEGAGKTTQLRRLVARLEAAGIPHAMFREPGGTATGDRIRELLLHADVALAPGAEVALFIASRAQLLHEMVRPALAEGRHVLLDRYLLSTYAYQIHGRGLPEDEVRAANRLAIADLVPDLTLLLRVPVAEGLARAAQRGAADRFERADRGFHERVLSAFDAFADPAWQSAHPECGPIVAIDAVGSEDDVEQRVLDTLNLRLPALSTAAGARA